MANRSKLALAFLMTLLFAPLARTSAASPQSGVVGWGALQFDSNLLDEPFSLVAAGAVNTVACRPNGTLAVWGNNYDQECIVPGLPFGMTYVAIAAGGTQGTGHLLALRSDGIVRAWGWNSNGQCNVPALPAGLSYSAVAAGASFSIGLRSDGTLVAWGDNTYGQCNVPAAPAGLGFVAISAGYALGLALRNDGVVVAWGWNSAGQLTVPALPAGLTYVEMSAGTGFGLARRSDGNVVAWGANYYGQCNVPALPSGMTYVEIAAGGTHALARRSDGALLAWGDSTDGRLEVPVLPPGLSYVELAASTDHSAARRSDGRVVCWGANRYSQCNTQILPPGVKFTQLVASPAVDYGPPGLLGLRSDGLIQPWSPVGAPPIALPPGVTCLKLAVGYLGSAALCSDGNVIDFGGAAVPALPPGVRYVDVATGGSIYDWSCGFGYWYYYEIYAACRSDGALVEWGDCPFSTCAVPTLPPGLGYDQVSASGVHVVARRSNGTVVAWGDTSAGECNVPALPPGVGYVSIVASGGNWFDSYCGPPFWVSEPGSLGLCSDGTIRAWGVSASAPVLPSGLAYVEIAGVRNHWLARRNNGSIVAWGNNDFGQCNLPALPAGENFVGIADGAGAAFGIYDASPPCGSVSRYCSPAAPNSASSEGATLSAAGCPGLSANNLVLDVSGLPPSRTGIMLYSSAQQQASFGNGWGCVAGGVQRVLPAILSSPTGTVSFPVDLTQFPYSGSTHSILAGSAWNFQFWYRDPTAPPSQFNLSDALHISFAP